MVVPVPTSADVLEAVTSYNSRFAAMDQSLWCVSCSLRAPLLQGQPTEGLARFVWTIKSWWSIQFVRKETKTLAAEALVATDWTESMFEEQYVRDSEQFAFDCVTRFVNDMKIRGVQREEFSLASKVLHWLMPWRIPVYDSFVRKTLDIPPEVNPIDAYRKIVSWEFAIAERLFTDNSEWLGPVKPQSPLRALDKYLWWIGGGSEGKAKVINDPWRICRELGLSIS